MSYFDRQLLDRGIDLRLGQEHVELSLTPVSEIESSEFVRLEANTPLHIAQQALVAAQATEAYVCDASDRLIGKVDIHSLAQASSIEQALDRKPISLQADDRLTQAMTTASSFVGESIPVVRQGRLISALSEGDIFNKVLQIQASLRQQ